MKKAIKIIIGAVVAIVALVIILVLALPLWIGPVATGVANAIAPKITGTDFNLAHFGLNPYSGVLSVGGLDLSNPPKYEEKTAVKLDTFKVDLGMTSLCGDVIHVEDVALDGLYVYASGLTGANFQDIAKHAQGDKTAEEKPAEAKPVEAKKSEGGKKVCIDHLVLKNIKVKIGPMPAIPVPTIELKDLGKPKDANDKGGISFEELWKTIFAKVMESANALGNGVKALGTLTGDGAKALGNLTGDGAKAAGEAAGKAVNAVGDGAKAAGEAAGNAVNAVGDGAKAAGEAAGKAAGKAVDAVGEGAKKAADALKSLF